MKKSFLLMLLTVGLIWNNSFASHETPTIKEQLIQLNGHWKDKSIDAAILEQRFYFDSHEDLIHLHLSLVEQHLRSVNTDHLTTKQIEHRVNCLDQLHNYRVRGVFPKNIYHSTVTPYFIDHKNTPCAVGHLIIETGNESLARQISMENNYAYIAELNVKYEELGEWADKNGFTVEELAWIQPGYGVYYEPIICDSTCSPRGTKVQSTFKSSRRDRYKYTNDAEKLALRFIYQSGSKYKDSIEIPQMYVEPALNVLMAIYNSPPGFTPRDTVVEMLNIHAENESFHTMNNFYFRTVGVLPWTLELANRNHPETGNCIIDDLLNNYFIEFDYQSGPSQFGQDSNIYTYYFNTRLSSNNVQAIISLLESIEGIKDAGTRNDDDLRDPKYVNINIGDYSVSEHYSEVTFFYKWQCSMYPCGYREYGSKGRSWKFRVYHDSIVEFVSSYGYPLGIRTNPSSIERVASSAIKVHPNPFTNQVEIESEGFNQFDFLIYNMIGEELHSGHSKSSEIDGLEFLPKGQYVLKVISNGMVYCKRLVKN